MVCAPHQYTLTKMAMSAYQPRPGAAMFYTSNQSERYLGGGIAQSGYTTSMTPQVNYNLATATGDQFAFQPLFQTSLLPNEQTRSDVSTIEKMLQPGGVVISDSPNPTPYSLPLMYVSQLSIPANSQENSSSQKDLSKLIQQELAELRTQVQYV